MATIVIADDDESMQFMMSQSLAMMGHQVLVAGDGSEGVRLVRQETPDVFITDVNMPGLDGLGAISELRTTGIDVPTILITAAGVHSILPLQDQNTHFLTKPFSPNRLMAFVSDVIAGVSSR